MGISNLFRAIYNWLKGDSIRSSFNYSNSMSMYNSNNKESESYYKLKNTSKYQKPFNYISSASKLPNRYSVNQIPYKSGSEKIIARYAWERDYPNTPYPATFDYY